jgi:peptidoglycan/LPS O-acetylase OafA/YrhL
VAVGLVVLEHATDWLPGGFIGVDVFFVISGFVITRLMLREFAISGTVSLTEFYSRRARRLMPALTVVLVATLGLSLLVLSPGLEQEKASWAALASFFFVANIRYIFEGGYFFLQSDPFRHIWSLGVEEQFYAFYPLMFLLVVAGARRFGVNPKRLLAATLLAISIPTLVFASLLANGLLLPLATRLSFFGTPFRLWELMTGAIIAVVLDQRTLKLGVILQMLGHLLGLGLIVWPALTYGPFTLFPGMSALPPVLGTAMLILVGSALRPKSGLLGWRPLGYIGDISYGLYLWHWPLIVFAKRLYPDASVAPIVAVIISVVLAGIQFRFVEQPLRRRVDVVGWRALRLLGMTAAVTVIVSVSLLAASSTGLGLEARPQFEPIPSIAANCNLSLDNLELAPQCTIEGDGDTRLLLIGDSQAAALSDGFAEVALQLKASYRIAFGNSCPVHQRENVLWPGCWFVQRHIQALAVQFQPDVIVVANAADLYVTRGGFGKPDARIPKEDGSFPDNYDDAMSNWISGLRGILLDTWLSDQPVIYVHMPPVSPAGAPSLLRRNPREAAFSLSMSFDRNEVVSREENALRDLPNVTLLDPADVLCPRDTCRLNQLGSPIYADSYHLNSRGATLLAPEMERLIRRALTASN